MHARRFPAAVVFEAAELPKKGVKVSPSYFSSRFRSRRSLSLMNAIAPKMNRHSIMNMTKLFVGVGRLSGNRAGSINKLSRTREFAALI
jgi:hypothetical protein